MGSENMRSFVCRLATLTLGLESSYIQRMFL